ncbi:Foldase protein prsA 1 precursor [Kingella potus]|uniref:Foldase protein prsA 1 n=1 Tax=Kingella potus TaxID=265175 RepID=A0A377R3C9_9NEIS|nr:peptidylprolyl isomerase [Kingella potus]STR02803.1 Foldase protein prsA 1 precursor [Kingella potus]
MKKHTLTLAAALTAAAFQTAFAADIRPVDGIAAVAGDAVITMRQLDSAAAAARQSLPAAQRPSENELRSHVLSQLVNRALVVQAGKRRGITATEAETDEALAQAAAQRHTTVENLYAQSAKNGISRAALRKDTAEGIIAEKVRQQAVLQQARVSDEEIDAALARAKQQGIALPAGEPVRQYRARHILIKAEKDNAATAAEAVIRKIQNQAKAGRDFGDLAKQYSQDTSAAQGGDLGWFGEGVMVPEFEEAVKKLKKGQISRPVKSQFGWHLIQLTDTREAGTPEERQRNALRQYIMRQKAEAASAQLLQQLHESAYVEVRL